MITSEKPRWPEYAPRTSNEQGLQDDTVEVLKNSSEERRRLRLSKRFKAGTVHCELNNAECFKDALSKSLISPFLFLRSVTPEIETMISGELFGIRNKGRASLGTVPDK
jgi:hypothetical protein